MNETCRTIFKWITIVVFVCGILFYSLDAMNNSTVDAHVEHFRRKLDDFRDSVVNNTFIQGHLDSLSKLIQFSSINATNCSGESPQENEATAYAVLASDHHFEYLFPLPIVVLSWRRLGVDAFVILIGTKEQYESDKKLNYVLSALRLIKTRIFFIQSKLADTFTMAQVTRLYAAALDGLRMSDSTVLITADADMFSFQLSQHVPDLKAGKKIFLYNSQCCGSMKLPKDSESYPHIPMNTIAMTVALWREVMNVSSNMIKGDNGDLVALRLYEEFGEKLVTSPGGKGSEKWSMDQNLISALLHRWTKKRPENKMVIMEKPTLGFRFDRSRWNFDFSRESLDGKGDAHFLHPMFGPNWSRMIGLLRLMFSSYELQWCIDYHTGFLKL